jgi:hypothetical protein
MSGRLSTFALLAVGALGCGSDAAPTVPVKSIPGHDALLEDTTPKQSPRLLPPEAYIHTYLQLFGGLSPMQTQLAAQAQDKTQLFDSWNDYLASLGLPDYRIDIPRATQTNALMLATFERLGVALCDRAVEHDLSGTAAGAGDKLIFDFDAPDTLDAAGFSQRFDVLHRTFLGYPAKLAPPDRVAKFFALYNDTVTRHSAKGAAKSRIKPNQAGWANVCYGLVRHPEFHLY